HDGTPCRVVTDNGTVTARAVLVATHSPFNSVLLQTKVANYRSYVLALRLKDRASMPEGLFWDTDEPYHYIRGQMTDEGPTLIVGGEDHKTGQEDDTIERLDALLEFATQRCPV